MQQMTIWRVKCLDAEGMRAEFVFHDKDEFTRFVNAPKPECSITDIIEESTINADTALEWLLEPDEEI